MMLNSSGEEQVNWNIKESHLENVFFAWSYSALLIVAVPANTLALWVFSQQEKNSPSKVFLTNLAVADLSYVMILPMRVVYHIMDGYWPFGEMLCRLAGYLFYLNMYCSLYFMACISLDRFLALVLPVQSLALRQRLVITRTISVLLWLFLGITMIPLLLSQQTVEVNNSTWTVCLQLYREKPSSQALVSLAVAFSVPSVVMVTSYTMILHKLRGLGQSDRRPMVKKAIRTIALTLLIYIVAFLPYHANRFIYIAAFAHRNVTAAEATSLWFANRITSFLTCVSGVLDPVLYVFLTSQYRKSVLWLLCRTRERDRQSTS